MKKMSAVLILIVGALIGPVNAGEAPISAAPAQLIDALARQRYPGFYDTHGNALWELRQLQILRFAATPAVTDNIDRYKHKPELREALYDVLGLVKDPASIPWLRAKLKSGAAAALYEEYLPRWTAYEAYRSWEWLTGREEWIAFWKDAFLSESSTDRRATLLRILAQFDDTAVREFFAERRSLASDPKEILVVESYLDAHDIPVDDERIEGAVARLARSSQNHEFLVETAAKLKHKAFVPMLIKATGTPTRVGFQLDEPEDILKSITFEMKVEGMKSWQTWFAEHAMQSRQEWRQHALDAFREVLKRDPDLAEKQFNEFVYHWNDMELYPFLESELSQNPSFHSTIAGWINLTYTDFHRQRLGVLAERISQHPEQLKDGAKRLLQERGYIPGYPKLTWAEAVNAANHKL